MDDERDWEISRRIFIQRLTFMGGGVLLFAPACKRDEPAASNRPRALVTSHKTFTEDEFSTVGAACERILPKDEDPGALDAEVPVYIDRMLATPELVKMKQDFLSGIAALDRRSRRMFQKKFFELQAAQQDELLTLFKDSPPRSGEAHFYELLIILTLEGFLGDPSYGGNKNRVGWALVGFGTSEPPPGYDGSQHLHTHGRH